MSSRSKPRCTKHALCFIWKEKITRGQILSEQKAELFRNPSCSSFPRIMPHTLIDTIINNTKTSAVEFSKRAYTARHTPAMLYAYSAPSRAGRECLFKGNCYRIPRE